MHYIHARTYSRTQAGGFPFGAPAVLASLLTSQLVCTFRFKLLSCGLFRARAPPTGQRAKMHLASNVLRNRINRPSFSSRSTRASPRGKLSGRGGRSLSWIFVDARDFSAGKKGERGEDSRTSRRIERRSRLFSRNSLKAAGQTLKREFAGR